MIKVLILLCVYALCIHFGVTVCIDLDLQPPVLFIGLTGVALASFVVVNFVYTILFE